MHMFMVRADDLSAFAHVHPARDGDASFTVPLPPLPAGDYRIYADIVHENGFAPTLVNTVRVPAPGPGAGGTSSAGGEAQAVPAGVFTLESSLDRVFSPSIGLGLHVLSV